MTNQNAGDKKISATLGIVQEVVNERMAQRAQWSEEHDDGYDQGELAGAAACYAVGVLVSTDPLTPKEQKRAGHFQERFWPWPGEEIKLTQHDRRKQLLIAAALCLAEIERIDRQEG